MNRKKSSFALATMLCTVSILTAIMIISCSEDTEDTLTMDTNDTTSTLADTKVLTDTAPGAPQLQQVPEGTPTVTSVGFYSDWKLTKPLAGTVPAGKTIFIKVVFSEEMKMVIADDKTARPILYYRKDKELTRFRIAGFGARGEDFVSGDAKPMKNKSTYLCKYVVQPEDKGEFFFAVGKFSASQQNKPMSAFYTHKEKLHLGKMLPVPGTPILAPARDSGTRGDNITNHTTVILAGKFAKSPPKGVSVQLYNNGDVIPKAIDTTIDRRNRWAVLLTLSEGTHTLTAKSKRGNQESGASKPLTLTIDTTPPRVKAKGRLDGTLLTIEVSEVHHYRYAIGEKDDFSGPQPAEKPIIEDLAAFPIGTVSAYIVGIDAAGNQEASPATVTVEKKTPAIPIPAPPTAKPDTTVPAQRPAVPPPNKTLVPVAVPRSANAAGAARKAELVILWVEHKRKLLEGNQATFLNRWFSEVLTPIGVSKNLRKEIFIIQFDGPTGIPARATGNERWFPETIREYLFLQLLHPTKGEKEILELFRQSVQSGKVVITRKFRLPKTTELQEVERLLPL